MTCVGPIRHNLCRLAMVCEHASEELPCCRDITPSRDVHVDHLAVLVDRPVDITPDTPDLHIGLIDKPPAAYRMAAGAGNLDDKWGEVLHPPEQADVIDLDPTLSEKLLEISVGQAEPQIPAHRQQDHLGREPVASEGRRLHFQNGTESMALHPASLTAPDGIDQCNSANHSRRHLDRGRPSRGGS